MGADSAKSVGARAGIYKFTASSPAVHLPGIDSAPAPAYRRRSRFHGQGGFNVARSDDWIPGCCCRSAGQAGDSTREISTEELEASSSRNPRPCWTPVLPSSMPSVTFPAPSTWPRSPACPISMYVSDIAEIGRLVRGNKAARSSSIATARTAARASGWRPSCSTRGTPTSGDTRWEFPSGAPPVASARSSSRAFDTSRQRRHRRRHRQPRGRRSSTGSLRGARNIPRSLVLEGKDVGEVKRAKDDGRLPMEDHNTRILVVGPDARRRSLRRRSAGSGSIPQRQLLRRAVRGRPERTQEER